MKLTIVLLTVGLLHVYANGKSQTITYSGKEASLKSVFLSIKKQTGVVFLYFGPVFKVAKPVNVNAFQVSLEDFLDEIFKDQALDYSIEGKSILVSPKALPDPSSKTVTNEVLRTPQELRMELMGKVTDDNGNPISGVTVMLKGTKRGTSTDSQGQYRINAEEGQTLLFSMVGFTSQEIKVGNTKELNVVMKAVQTELGEVVVTGMMDRKKESFTGAAVTISGDQLKMIGNQNVLQSLKTLDPSIIFVENNSMGANPNTLPTIELRGKTGLSQDELKDQFGGDPNQPLFILDGFESDLRTIIDLDINRVATITILKDAASTSLYGARAANGVIVVKTKEPVKGTLRVNYTADFRLELLDLSNYNLMNAEEKLEFERLSGRFTDKGLSTYFNQAILDTMYFHRLAKVKRGVNTDWLRMPGQTGFTNGHSLYADGGDEQVRYGVGINYRNANGLMQGSGRETWGANVDLMYNKGKLRFANKMYINGFQANESPFGSFSDFSRASPYNSPYDSEGNIAVFLETLPRTSIIAGFGNFGNPLYNASLNNLNRTTNLSIQNNLQATVSFNHSMKLEGAIQMRKGGSKNVTYFPPEHTKFQNSNIFERGSYAQSRTDNFSYSANLMFTYAKTFAEQHTFTNNVRADIEETENELFTTTAVGFPMGTNGDPGFAFSYQPNSKPQRTHRLYRRNNILANVNYSFDQRFVLDATYRLDGSTAFGSNKQYAPFWSAGVGWNLHNEAFINKSRFNLLRIRGNVGTTGNQGFGSISSVSTYGYIANSSILGQGVTVLTYGNKDLAWQKTLQTSVGVDLTLFNNRFAATFNAYTKDSDPLVVFINPASSTGVVGYATNAGNLTTKGLEANIRFSPLHQSNSWVWSVGVLAGTARSKYNNFKNLLNSVNEKQLANNSLTRYTDGYSPDDIWAVQSAGIDPGTGRELFVGADGKNTFTYNVNDIRVVGNLRPDVEGVISSNLSYKHFQLGIHLRYSVGGDVFNSALYNKVENIDINSLYLNQDKRALYDRWQKPGDVAQFKGISLTDRTPMSSRFVQRNNFISGESFNIGYRIEKSEFIRKIGLKAVRFNFYMNDIFRLSSVKVERGIDYPFANTISSSINVSF